jgi:hypothetical protein
MPRFGLSLQREFLFGDVMDAELNPKELLNRILQLKEHL